MSFEKSGNYFPKGHLIFTLLSSVSSANESALGFTGPSGWLLLGGKGRGMEGK